MRAPWHAACFPVVTYEVLQALWFFVPAFLANMSPVLVRRRVVRLAVPIDGGRTFHGTRVFGDHKTWRGLLAGIVVGVLAYEAQRCAYGLGLGRGLALIDYAARPVLPGLLLGLGTGVGDAVKSFFKRRVGIAPGHSWPVFDQLDFMAGAYAFVALIYAPPLPATLAALPVVLAGGIVVSAIGFWLHLREAWI
jgi:CDP-2,3-bis-(O-geranylgeranyl)-sn-glycerol synthase